MPEQPEEILLRWLREARRVIAFCGAGVSAESGLATFRGGGGLWEGHRVEDVATPEAFARDPVTVWRFYAMRQEALRHAEPNAAHRALAAMERRYERFLLVTQNVDDLHERAGSRELVKLHGNLMEVRCARCGESAPLEAPVPAPEIDAGRLPCCGCGGMLRPNVVWFGEPLDMDLFRRIEEFLWERPDLLLVIGTSGEVGGGYGLTRAARARGALVVEINPEPSLLSRDADLVLREPAGRLLGGLWARVEAAGPPAG